MTLKQTDADVASINVGEFKAVVTFTQEAAKRVHALPVTRTGGAKCTLINI